MKKITILIIIISMFATSIGWSLTFSDVDSLDWFYPDVMELTNQGIINGFADGTFRPQDSINVDQFIKLIIYSLGYNYPIGETYWAQPFIDKALELELIDYEEFSSYNRAITRGEMATIIVRALNEPYNNEMYEFSFYMNDYFENNNEDILKAYYFGIITGYPDGNFYANKTATRAEASAMIMRMIDESRRVDTDYFLYQNTYLMLLNRYYVNLKDYYLDAFNDGIDNSQSELPNGDLYYESDHGIVDAYVWANGDRFIGEMNQGEYGEKGLMQWIDGSEYIGEFANDNRTGEGVMILENAVYSGDFLNNKMTGNGMIEWADGYSFIGLFNQGQINGLGKENYPNGDYYIGNFIDGIQDGRGLYTYENGLVYFGTFNDNEIDNDDFIMYYKTKSTLEFVDKTQDILEEILTNNMSNNQKIIAIHDYIVLNVTYDQDGYDSDEISAESHSAYGALIKELAVCDGYASAFNHLLNNAGITSDIVLGEANGEGHAWNYVLFEEGKYYVDVTWDDGDDGKLRYDYYKKTLNQMNEDHVVSKIVK